MYGALDQAGNVWGWNDAVIFGSSRGLRGGSWLNNGISLVSAYRNSLVPSNGNGSFGFRVASAPEPNSLVLTMLASGVILLRRRWVNFYCKVDTQSDFALMWRADLLSSHYDIQGHNS